MIAHHRSLLVTSVVKNMTSIHEVMETYCISFPYSPMHGCHRSGNGQGKKKFFKVREMSGNFIMGQGKLAFLRKVREN